MENRVEVSLSKWSSSGIKNLSWPKIGEISRRGALVVLVSRYVHHIYMKNNPMPVKSTSGLHTEHEVHAKILWSLINLHVLQNEIYFSWKLVKEALEVFIVCFILCVWQSSDIIMMIILSHCSCMWNHWSWHSAFYSCLTQMEVPHCLFHGKPWNKLV